MKLHLVENAPDSWSVWATLDETETRELSDASESFIVVTAATPIIALADADLAWRAAITKLVHETIPVTGPDPRD